MYYHITNDLFSHRVSHAVVGSSNIEGSGLALAGTGFGKGARKKVLKTVGKVARSGIGLVKAFGSNEQKEQTAVAETAYNIVEGAGAPKKPAANCVR